MDAHLGGAESVLQEPLQDAGAEQLGPLRGLSLVVEVVRAPAVRDRRVVDPVDQLARAPFTDERAIHGRLLVDGIGLQRVSDRLMEQDTPAAVRDDDRHLAGRRGDRVEHRDGAGRRSFGRDARGMGVEELDARTRGRPVPPRLDDVATLRHDLGDQPDPRPLLVDPPAVRGSDQPPLQRIEVDPGDLRHLGAVPTRGLVDLPEPSDLVGSGHAVGRAARAVGPRPEPVGEVDDGPRDVASERRARRRGGFEQGVAIELVGVRVTVAGALRHPDPGPAIQTGRQFFDLPVVQADRRRRALFDEDLREITTLAASRGEDLGDQRPIEHGGDATKPR